MGGKNKNKKRTEKRFNGVTGIMSFVKLWNGVTGIMNFVKRSL